MAGCVDDLLTGETRWIIFGNKKKITDSLFKVCFFSFLVEFV